ncbi:Zinc finger BED domain-containing protein RICESLEEPER 3 [Bienertia sinuspersici]
MGTGNLRRHLKNCKMRSFMDVGKMILEKNSSGVDSRMPKFDADVFRELVALIIVRHDLPFQFIEYDGIRRCFTYLNADAKFVSRYTLKADVMKMFKREKEKLKVELSSVSGRISLTSDCWTSITTDGYISLTAHFVDNEWCLQKRILNFSFMPLPHSGIHMCDKVCGMLKDWEIQKKIFSITLDNATSNDVFAENLKGELDLFCVGGGGGVVFSCEVLCSYIESSGT